MKKYGYCLFIFLLLFIFSSCSSDNILRTLPHYYGSEKYMEDGFQDYTDFCKYYYKSDVLNKLDNNPYLTKISSENIEDIKAFFTHFKKQLDFMDWKSKYDFNTSEINTEDYCYIKIAYKENPLDNYSVYYFDKSKLILYYIHTNI